MHSWVLGFVFWSVFWWLFVCLVFRFLGFFFKSYICFTYNTSRQKRKPATTATQVINQSIKLLSRPGQNSQTAQCSQSFHQTSVTAWGGGSPEHLRQLTLPRLCYENPKKLRYKVLRPCILACLLSIYLKKKFHLGNFNFFIQLCPQILITVLLAPFLPQ